MLHLLSLKQILEPLAVASRVTQATVCHLDQVLLTFGYLIMQYQELLNDSADVPGAYSVIASIEKRWKAADQELFIAAVLLNPFYLSNKEYLVFANLHFLNKAGIHALLG